MTIPVNNTVSDTDLESETTSTDAINTVTSTTITTTATTNGYVNKWVRNLSDTSLTEAQVLLLAHGPNFAVSPRHPHGEYITVIEQACMKLEPHNAEELRAEMRGALRHSQKLKSNITKQEVQALAELKKDQSRVILTADKGVAMVVMDKEDYKKKAQTLLEDRGTYKIVKGDPTNRMKTKLINLIKKIKSEGGINDNQYRKLYPTGAVPPKFYGLLKVHKRDIPLRPIVSIRGSISYELAKELARILKPLVGSSPHNIKNTGDFIEHIKCVTLQANETITSYDVSALFTSVPIDPAIQITQRRLELEQELHSRTTMEVEHNISLLEFCLKTTYFQFQGRFYEQISGAAMGSAISLIVDNLFMEDFEVKAINTAQNPPKMWKRYVDNTCVILDSARKEEFLQHINSVDPHIQFTVEDAKPDGSILFLDTIVMPQPDESIKTTVVRKPTHTDMYLHWDRYHHQSAKFSVINTLRHRAKTVCSTSQLLKEEENHLHNALRRCKYPLWAWNTVNINKNQKRENKGNNNNNNSNSNNINKPYIVVPYMKGLRESCKNICRKHGVEVYFKGGSTIRDLLVHQKDKDTILQKSGVIYRYRGWRVDCEDEYIGESCRTFGERFREHMRVPSPIIDRQNITGHDLSLDNFSIVGREDNSLARKIKEAIFIRVIDPSLNRNIGKFQLPHIWDEVLARSPELNLK